MKLPIQKVLLPATLAGKQNGKLPDSILTEVPPWGKLEKTAARAWFALVAAAKDAGFEMHVDGVAQVERQTLVQEAGCCGGGYAGEVEPRLGFGD